MHGSVACRKREEDGRVLRVGASRTHREQEPRESARVRVREAVSKKKGRLLEAT